MRHPFLDLLKTSTHTHTEDDTASVVHVSEMEDEEEDFFSSIDAELENADEIIQLAMKRQLVGLDEEIHLYPSEWAEVMIQMPVDGRVENFSLAGRRYLPPIYDLQARRVLLVFGRQCEKSTLLGNKILSLLCTVPHFRALYVSPTLKQTKTFRRDRISGPMAVSDMLSAYITPRSLNNVSTLQLINFSVALFFYAFLSADRIRGNTAYAIFLDEVQDIITDLIPVIEECAFHAPPALKSFTYSGTPKSFNNTIEYYWSQLSTQNEWAIPCNCKGFHDMSSGLASKRSAKYLWNAPIGEANIGLKGLICARCGKPINAQHEEATWVSMNGRLRDDPDLECFEGFRVPQLLVPWVDWGEILHKRKTYAPSAFYNEVLALSFDSGTRPLRTPDLMRNSHASILMSQGVEILARKSAGSSVFMGIDWGNGEKAYTVVCIGGYLPEGARSGKFTVFYFKKYTGNLLNADAQLEDIERLMAIFKPMHVGVDYGVGHDRNQKLINRHGMQKVSRFQYLGTGYGSSRKKIAWDGKLGRYVVNRTEVMTDVFTAIKEDKFLFPAWDDWKDFAQEFLAIFSEYDDRLRTTRYDKNPNSPDDAFHAFMYCMLASNIRFPRTDIFRPTQGGGALTL